MAAISRSAPGKLILCGEHAVVYHQPAIALPVLQALTTTNVFASPLASEGEIKIIARQIGIKSNLADLSESHPIYKSIHLILDHFHLDHLPACEIRVSSTIPLASGLGSSASTSVSLIRAISDFIGQPMTDSETNQLAYEMEKIHHGNPSGIDNTVVTFSRPIFFIRDEPIEFIKMAQPLEILIADTGIQASTSSAISMVKERWQSEPQKLNALFEGIGTLTRQIRQFLISGETHVIGSLLTQNHHALQEMGVSCPELDRLVTSALESGALGAKLSGGGLGGNMLALVEKTSTEKVKKALLEAGAVSVIHTSVEPTVGSAS